MRAAFLTGFGDERVMSVGELPEPVRSADQVLVDVHAAGVNPVEIPMRDGSFPSSYRFPQVPGFDISGTVLEAPPGSGWEPGQAVFGRLPSSAAGAYAERAVIAPALLAPKPASLSHVQAASLPTIALTAWQGLVERAGLRRGEHVLIQAGAGGVGSFAIQLARHLGARVSATAGSANQDLLARLQVDRAIDYNHERFEDLGPYDVVFDGVGGALIESSIASLAPGGRYVGLVKAADARAYLELGLPEAVARSASAAVAPYIAQAQMHGAHYHGVITRPDGQALRQIAALVDDGVIVTVIGQVFALERWAEAYRHLASGRTRGKVVIDLTA